MEKEAIILEALKDNPDGLRFGELVKTVGEKFPEMNPKSLDVVVNRSLRKLSQAGLVVKEGNCWKLSTPPKQPPEETCFNCGCKLEGYIHQCSKIFSKRITLVRWDGEWLPVSWFYSHPDPQLFEKTGYYCAHCGERFSTLRTPPTYDPILISVVCVLIMRDQPKRWWSVDKLFEVLRDKLSTLVIELGEKQGVCGRAIEKLQSLERMGVRVDHFGGFDEDDWDGDGVEVFKEELQDFLKGMGLLLGKDLETEQFRFKPL